MTLKPCPFCGGEAVREMPFGLAYHIRCATCGVSTASSKIVQDCEDLWNKRVDTSEEEGPLADFKAEIIAELSKKPEVIALGKAFANGVIDCLADLLSDDEEDDV